MFYNQRKTIAVFIESAKNEFQNRLCQGIIQQAEACGYNVAFFSSFGKYGENEKHFQGDQSLYELPDYASFDGVILALDTMEQKSTRELVLSKVRSLCTCPVVSVREIVEGANNLLVGNQKALHSIVAHFAEDHGFTRIACMSGPKERWDAKERMQSFLDAMEAHGLPVDEHQLFWGDFWRHKGEEAADWFLSSKTRPQAVICANDQMAQALINAFLARDIHVPDDICVSGYDGLQEGEYFVPSITSMGVPFYDMGAAAVGLIDKKQGCPQEVETLYFDATPILRESCGCLPVGALPTMQARRKQFEATRIERNRDTQFNYFSIQLEDSDTFVEMAEHANYYSYNLANLHRYVLCLKTGNERGAEDTHDFPDTMRMFVNVRHVGEWELCEETFLTKELLPKRVCGEAPQFWYFTPIHFQNICYGYDAFQFMDASVTGQLYFQWNVLMGNKLYDIYMARKMERLVQQLEDWYDKDALTGMYNRRGWKNRIEPLIETAKAEEETVFLAVIDLDFMKQINDNYGHAEGDFALCKIKEVMEEAFGKAFLYARTGGDEFAVAAKGLTLDVCKAALAKMTALLEAFNATKEKPYQIFASQGFAYGRPTALDSEETFMAVADEKMYAAKEANKAARAKKEIS